MKILRILCSLALLFFYSFSLFSQTKSLWSQIRKDRSDVVGLNALQYQVPLVGESKDFFDINKIRGKNDWVVDACNWLVRDFNNDGFADVFLAFNSTEKESLPFILLFYDKNSGTYKDKSLRLKNNTGQFTTRKIMSADFNGDGILDMVAVCHPECDTCRFSYFDVLLSNSDTTWTQKTLRKVDRFKCEGYNHGVAIGDIDNDGDIDIVLANENSCKEGSICYINDGKGNFTPNPVSTINRGQNFVTNAWTAELADLNKDGCLDLLYWHDTSNTRILYGNCKKTFDTSYQNLGPFKYPYIMDFDVRDFDGDGDFDLLLTTTDYFTGWELVFLENAGIDSSGKVIWVDHTEAITRSLKNQGFYPSTYYWLPYINVVDLNGDGILDILPQTPLSNIESFNGPFPEGQWILLGNSSWGFNYKKPPFAEPPKSISSTIVNGKVNLFWERVKQSYSASDGGINKWAIYISDKNWGDRSQVSKPILVLAKETKTDSGTDQYVLNPTSGEMYVRISPIDSTGIEWPLSDVLKVSILPPSISNATVCNGTSLTITGTDFVGITSLTVGGTDVLSYSVISDKTIQATLNTGQTGNVTLTTVAGNTTFSDVTSIVPSTQPFAITGKKSPLNGELETYSVPVYPGVSFNWLFPQGWVQSSGGNSNAVTVNVGATGGSIQVFPSASCGNLKPISFPVAVYTYVPDDNFQKALRNLGIDNANKPDSVLTSALISVKELYLDSMNIADLTGIQDFVDLRVLKCGYNELKDLNVTGNELLEDLDCSNNSLKTIVVTKNRPLRILACTGNPIPNLDVSQNAMLNVLLCDGIPITSLNVSSNTELALLSIYGQEINYIDLSNNPKLSYFSCVNCRLNRLDVSRNLKLSLLNCAGNQITSLDVSKNSALEYLGCSGNKLENLNLKNGKNSILKTFYAQNNTKLSCIEVDDFNLASSYPNWEKDASASYSENCRPIITSISPSAPCKGTTVTVTGANFLGVSAVDFGGTKATSFTVLSSTSISAIVGEGTSGILSISSGAGTGTLPGVQIGPLPAEAITGMTTVCKGQSSVIYTVPAIANTTAYTWTLPTGATGTSTTNSISVSYGSSAISGNISVKGHNDCGDGAASSLAVTVSTLPFGAGSISGTTTVCPGQNSVNYTVPVIANATSYIWTLPTGTSGTSLTNSISVDYGESAISGNITVKGHNACGDGADSNLAITVNPLPASAGPITGSTTVCPGQNSVTYTVPVFANAASYIWSLPTGTTGTSTTNDIIIDYGASATSGNIVVKGRNDCGDGATTILAIIVNPLPGSAGIITGAASICPGQNSVSYSIPVISNASSYIWTLPTGATGTSVTNSISVDYGTSAISGNITVKGQNECGDGTQSSLAVTVNPKPATPVVTQTGNTLHSSASNGNQWYNSNSLIGGATNQDYTFTATGKYTVVVTLNGCASDTSTTNVITGSDQMGFSKKIVVYPNPVSDDLTIEYSGNFEEVRFTIVNLAGQLLFDGKLLDKTIVHTSSFAAGLYFIKFDVGKTVEFKKVIKN